MVLWELLTGERPYDGFGGYRVAYGVGGGNLKLPVPENCPEPLSNIMLGELSLSLSLSLFVCVFACFVS